MAPVMHTIDDWIAKNKQFFTPPICNKLMYQDGQLKCFFVGGPNVRKDFHMEEGEEFFYMLKGDMNLVVVEKGEFRDIVIREGEVFLLPARIPHSPQRFADTIGLVIERERAPSEVDCLRYYVEGTTEILYERFFHCDSLDSQLPPLIKEFFASEQARTGKPIPDTILKDKPVQQNYTRTVDQPFSLLEWVKNNQEDLKSKGRKALFTGDYTSRVTVLGEGIHYQEEDCPETFLWQLEGCASIENEGQVYSLNAGCTMLIEECQRWNVKNDEDSVTLSVVMNPYY